MSAAELLATIAGLAEVFHAADGKCFASIPVNRHEETWPVRSKRFKAWLSRAFYLEMKKPPPTQAMAETVAMAEARALDGPELPVHVRVAEHDGGIYVDLADEHWRAVRVDDTGWRVVPRPPVKFHRAPGMLALPEPVAGGNLDALRPFLNVNDDYWRLIVHWLAMALHPRGPYPVLALHGEQGAAKSTATRVLRELVDPNAAPLRSEPRDPRDVMIAASHGWVIALDNLSSLSAWLSDAICRLATGGGFSTRQLYTDDEEVIFSAKRPVIVNGIEEVVARGDLMQRALLVELAAISPEHRREEDEFWADFAAVRPSLFGALLAAVAGGLRESPQVRLTSRPRMADFARWSVAVEQGLGWSKGEFLKSYDANISGAHEVVVESSPVGQAVRALVEEVEWTGTVSELLETLTNRVAEATKRSKAWPTSARALSGALRRLAPNLRALGVEVSFLDRTERGRQVKLTQSRSGNDRQNIQPRPDGPDGPDGHFPGLNDPPPTVSECLWRLGTRP